jgi:hypothetical protein
LHRALKRLRERVRQNRLKDRDKVLECVGRYKASFPQAAKLATIQVARGGKAEVSWKWKTASLLAAMAQDVSGGQGLSHYGGQGTGWPTIIGGGRRESLGSLVLCHNLSLG